MKARMFCGNDVFLARLQGELVECENVDDAVAILTADRFLARRELAYRPFELDQLAAVLLRYGRPDAAQKLSAEAWRMRAADLLNQSGLVASGGPVHVARGPCAVPCD
jgi:hypothetical protein